MVLLGIGGHLAQLRHFPRETVDIRHGEVNFRFLGGGQRVKNGVGEPPMAMSSVMAFLNADLLPIARGNR